MPAEVAPELLRSALDKMAKRAEQKAMQNSIQQARNIDGAFARSRQPMPRGPVLLVDDMVDSRWTLTVAAWLLPSLLIRISSDSK